MEETRIVGTLPSMRIEISHREAPSGQGEQVTIQLTAMPDFRSVQPMLAHLGPMAPLAAWSAMAQAMLAPWQALADANPFLKALPGLGAEPKE